MGSNRISNLPRNIAAGTYRVSVAQLVLKLDFPPLHGNPISRTAFRLNSVYTFHILTPFNLLSPKKHSTVQLLNPNP